MVSLAVAHDNESKLLQYLEENGINFERHTHPVVLTVDDQAAQLGNISGAIAKNILLKDKKGRLILVSALASTPVDLKLLSQRLGLGKGGLRLAPLENLATVLQVPEGSVTPMALFNESARSVPLLLDQGFKSHSHILVHPLVNDSTIALTMDAFEAFLRSQGREANYVDLEAVVVVGKDQPPDLAHLIPGTKNDSIPAASPQSQDCAGQDQAEAAPAAGSKGSKGPAAVKAKPGPSALNKGPPGDDVQTCADAIVKLMLTSSLCTAKDKSPSAESVGGGQPVGLSLAQKDELEHILVMFKNAAYTHGFSAALASLNLRAG